MVAVFSRLALGFGCMILALMVGSARADSLFYSESGGGISGTLNGVSFSDATFSIVATADTSTITYTNPVFPIYSVFVTPTLTLVSGGNSSTVTLLATGGTNWSVISADLTGFSSNTSEIGFGLINGLSASGAALAGSGYFDNLASAHTFYGNPLWNTNFTFSTSAGDLVIGSSSGTSGSFTISSVPEPSSFVLAAFGVLLLIAARRRNEPKPVRMGSESGISRQN